MVEAEAGLLSGLHFSKNLMRVWRVQHDAWLKIYTFDCVPMRHYVTVPNLSFFISIVEILKMFGVLTKC